MIKDLVVHKPIVAADPKVWIVRVVATTDKTNRNQYLASHAAFLVNSDEERDNLIKIGTMISEAVKQVVNLDKENG